MKKKLFFAFIATLAVGLLFVGCPNGGDDNLLPLPPLPPTGPGLDELTPLELAQIPPPESGYVDFPADELLENYSSFAGGQGQQAEIEANDDGTYTARIKTTPGGVSFLSLNGENYLFANGFYLSLDLPETAEHKPLAAWAAPSTAPGDLSVYWTAQQTVNMSGPAVADRTKYLAGEVDFAWENLEYDGDPFKSIVLEFYWHEDETDGNYEFTISKVLIHDGDDLTPSKYPDTAAYQTNPPLKPAGWTDILASVTITSIPASSATAGDNGNDITVKTRKPNSRIYLEHSKNIKGYYALLGLPETTTAKPVSAKAFVSAANENSANWGSLEGFSAGKGKYAAGDVVLYWKADEGDNWNYVNLYLDWHSEETDGTDYSFTIKELLVLEDGSEVADPTEGWLEFPVDTTAVTFSPVDGKIIDNSDGTYAVTVKTCANESEWSHTEVVFKVDDFAFKGGYYLSVTLPEQAADSTTRPSRVYTFAQNGSTINWNSAVDYDKRGTDGWWEGDLKCFYTHETFGRHDAIVLYLYWVDGVTAGQDYEFTINAIKVAEETAEGPAKETPVIHDSSKLDDAVYALDEVAEPLVVVPAWTANSASYTYEWWEDTSPNQSTWPAENTGITTNTFTPPTDVEGIFYYYCVVKYPYEGTQALTRVIKITVTP